MEGLLEIIKWGSVEYTGYGVFLTSPLVQGERLDG